MRSLAPLVAALALLLAPSHADADGKVIATVGGVPVTGPELMREIQKILPLNVGFHSGVSGEKMNEIRDKAFERLADRARMVRWALENGLNADTATLDRHMAEVKARFKSEEELNKALAGETLDDLRSSLKREQLANAARAKAVESRSEPTSADVQAYYAKYEHTYMRPRQFKASHILVKVDPSASEDDRSKLRRKAEELAEKAKAGEDFYNLAYYNSDDRTKYVGGDLGLFHEGQTVEEFEAALRAMKPGEISGVVESLVGFHVIKLVERHEPRKMAFEEVEGKIRSTLVERRKTALFDSWISLLRTQYPVEMAVAN
jgi:parvulin-like peptidyl-prolyl isomerase